MTEKDFEDVIAGFVKEAKKARQWESDFSPGIGVTMLQRALLTRWAMEQPDIRTIIEAARKFKDVVLYTMAGLAVGRLGEEATENAD